MSTKPSTLEPAPMMTFREKSAAACLAITALAFGAYGYWVVQNHPTAQGAIGGLVGIIVAQILLQIPVHICFALQGKPEGLDERDLVIDRLAQRNAYFILFGLVWGVMVMALTQTPVLTIAYALVATIVVSEMVRFASLLFYYRRGL
jgi:hypothetical protein